MMKQSSELTQNGHPKLQNINSDCTTMMIPAKRFFLKKKKKKKPIKTNI